MRITVTMTGGWGGLRQQRVIETQNMRRDDAELLETLATAIVEEPRSQASPRARDARTYVIEMERLGKQFRATVKEGSTSLNAESLLEMIRKELPSLR